MRILLVEDDPSTARAIELMLTAASYNVFRTDMGEEGIDLAKLYDYDLILLDLDLPDMHGMEVLRHLRLARIDTPILILTGSDDTESKLRGFGFGADDYMTKPFNREELQARIQAIIRRSKGHSQALIQTGEIVVNLDARSVEVRGKPVNLTGKEYQILELLSLRKGTTLTKEMFLKHLQSYIFSSKSTFSGCVSICISTFAFGCSCVLRLVGLHAHVRPTAVVLRHVSR